jgi:proteasome lid subunit RPN8/RPN11
MTTAELERAITWARKTGDTKRLERLQARYRRESWVERPAHGRVALRDDTAHGASGRVLSASGTRADRSTPARRGATAAAPTQVTLRIGAYDAIETRGLTTAYEQGAWCFGHIRGHEIEVVAIDGWQRGTYDTVRIDRDRALEAAFRQRGLALVGDIHSHPHMTELSQHDIDGSRRMSAQVGHPLCALLVCGQENEFPYLQPTVRGFVATGAEVREVRLINQWEVY